MSTCRSTEVTLQRRASSGDTPQLIVGLLRRWQFGGADVVAFGLDLQQRAQNDQLLLVLVGTPPHHRSIVLEFQVDRVLRVRLDVLDLSQDISAVLAQEG